MNITTFTVLQRVEQNIFETGFADKVIVLKMEEEAYHCLNETGSQLWHWLKEPHTAQTLAQKLSESYACSPAECQADVLAWLQDNCQRQLLHIIQEPPIGADSRNTYHSPKTSSFDAKTIQANTFEFWTDNFEMSS